MLKWLIDWWTCPAFHDRVLSALAEFDFDPTASQIAVRLNPEWPPLRQLYPELARLEREGVVESRWLDEHGLYPRRLIYKLRSKDNAET